MRTHQSPLSKRDIADAANWSCGFVVSLLLTSSVAGSIPKTIQPPALRALSEWVLQTGAQSAIRSHIVEVMHLPAIDMPVRERGFRVTGETMTHVCSVSTAPGYTGLLFFALVNENDGSATVWRTTTSGELINTVRFFAGVAVLIPNEEARSIFDAERAYFLKKLQQLPRNFTDASLDKASLDSIAAPKRLRSMPLGLEARVIASNPLVLPVIIFALVIGARSTRRRT